MHNKRVHTDGNGYVNLFYPQSTKTKNPTDPRIFWCYRPLLPARHRAGIVKTPTTRKESSP